MQQVVNVGSVAFDGTGDKGQVPFNKANSNFTDLYSHSVFSGVDTGAANAYVVATFTPTPAAAIALSVGMIVIFTPVNANNAASTLNFAGTGAIAIVDPLGAALDGAELLTTGPVGVRYTGSAWQTIFTNSAALIETLLTAATIGSALYPQTAAELAAGVTPTIYYFPELDLRRYGGDPTGSVGTIAATTTAINNAFLVSVAAQRPVIVPPGRFIHGRLATITGAVSLFGTDPTRCILSLSQSSWPYAGPTTTPVFSSAFDFIATGVGFDQAWSQAFAGTPGTYNDGASPSTWGGYFLGVLTGTGTMRFFGCAFFNIYRGFQITNAQRVIFEHNQGQTFTSIGESIITCEGVGSVSIKANQLECTKWTVASGALYGLTATFCYNCSDINISSNQFIGYQLHGLCSTVGRNATAMIIGNVIDTPVADTGFFNFYSLAICNNVITQSGDMGISTDNSQYLTVIGNQIRGTHVGGISIGGAVNATVVGNSIVDYAQDYPIINTIAARYASTGGVWLAGISIGFQSGNAGGAEIIFSGNTVGMVNLPPVSDTSGPVRANVLGIIFQETPTFGSAISGSVTGNYVHKDYTNLPQMFVRVPSHRFNYSALTGTPISGELFTNGANSFVFLTTTSGTLVMMKKLIGTIPATTVFTGALSGATITSSGTPGIAWHNVVDTGNFDWTTVYNPY
jgi:hypothetical protein